MTPVYPGPTLPLAADVDLQATEAYVCLYSATTATLPAATRERSCGRNIGPSGEDYTEWQGGKK